MKLATDNNSLSSYRIAADLDTKPGNKYTGNIKSPSENIYSLVLNGVTYWSIDTSVSGQLTIKVLPITLQKSDRLKQNNGSYCGDPLCAPVG